MTPIHFRREDILAYEHRTGFFGFGEFLERKGAIVMIEKVIQCPKVATE